jgi:nitrite reductase/ring-hydroxylating ferredoxin subunit
MTTRPAAPAPPSRLDPEPVARRDFLGLAAMWSAIVTLAFATVGALRLPRAAVVPVPSRKFRVALPDALAAGQAFVPPGRSVAVFKDGSGIWAVSTICTHLGCIVKREGEAFSCPCHGSRFALDGTVTKGPAPKALAWLAVTAQADGSVLVDESKTVPAGTKVTV